jgi:phage terminase large subunit-like protein
MSKYAGTRLGRQELDGEIVDDVPGALWTRAMLDACRVEKAPEMARVVIGVDPSGTGGADDEGDPVGIVAAGRGVDGRGYLLGDYTCKLSPDAWARRAVTAYYQKEADRIVAERNFGGAMVQAVIRTADANVPYKEVVASRGKVARAEPVAALFEQGRVSIVGSFQELEDEMVLMTSSGFNGEGSPNRVDAAVWALTEVMLGHQRPEPPKAKPIPSLATGFNRR